MAHSSVDETATGPTTYREQHSSRALESSNRADLTSVSSNRALLNESGGSSGQTTSVAAGNALTETAGANKLLRSNRPWAGSRLPFRAPQIEAQLDCSGASDLPTTSHMAGEEGDAWRKEDITIVDKLACEMRDSIRCLAEGSVLLGHYEQLLPILGPGAVHVLKKTYSLDSLVRGETEHRQIHCLRTSNNELHTLARNGKSLPKNAGLILIRGDLENAQTSVDLFLTKLGNSHPDTFLEGQQYGDPNATDNPKFEVVEQIERYRQRTQSAELPLTIQPQEARNHQQDLPRNILSLSGDFGLHVALPQAVQHLGYTLLDVARLGVDANYRQRYETYRPRRTAGKEQSTPNWLVDATACLRFCLWGERGAVSLNHLDILNGTWVTCLSGVKLWFVYDGPWNEEIRMKFKNTGSTWVPLGHTKVIVLRAGDTFIMRPGYPIVHSVLTLQDSIMVGGMIWSQPDLVHCMANIKYIMDKDHADVTNEHIPKQLPAYFNELLAMMRRSAGAADKHPASGRRALIPFQSSDVVAVESAIRHLKLLLSCKSVCKEDTCSEHCPCGEETTTRTAGCTVWCHDDPSDFRDPVSRWMRTVMSLQDSWQDMRQQVPHQKITGYRMRQCVDR
ncbi:hypothetical protein FB567DRAFT_554641 [Paraphoma chrysanthemicola]|uniref:JmjC domain-containing protein n=1 Tax=Paraphoma chrysanthemicola TaxID=798071 RepID=A0A8K0QVG8_9PLEO|nr:hypothetical protein FB567DRAFT_554641 [Paraphoma chrysanthemicola]